MSDINKIQTGGTTYNITVARTDSDGTLGYMKTYLPINNMSAASNGLDNTYHIYCHGNSMSPNLGDRKSMDAGDYFSVSDGAVLKLTGVPTVSGDNIYETTIRYDYLETRQHAAGKMLIDGSRIAPTSMWIGAKTLVGTVATSYNTLTFSDPYPINNLNAGMGFRIDVDSGAVIPKTKIIFDDTLTFMTRSAATSGIGKSGIISFSAFDDGAQSAETLYDCQEPLVCIYPGSNDFRHRSNLDEWSEISDQLLKSIPKIGTRGFANIGDGYGYETVSVQHTHILPHGIMCGGTCSSYYSSLSDYEDSSSLPQTMLGNTYTLGQYRQNCVDSGFAIFTELDRVTYAPHTFFQAGNDLNIYAVQQNDSGMYSCINLTPTGISTYSRSVTNILAGGTITIRSGYGTSSGITCSLKGKCVMISGISSSDIPNTGTTGTSSAALHVSKATLNGVFIAGGYGTLTNSYADYSNTKFLVTVGSNTGARRNGLRILSSGKAYFYTSVNSSGAGLTETFEWLDANPDCEDRVGHFVTLEGEKIRYAEPTDDYVLGAVDPLPYFTGDSGDTWHGMHLKDVFGRTLTERVFMPKEVTEDGEVLWEDHYEDVPIVNPEFDPDKCFVAREDRKEFATISSKGKVVLIDDGTCQVNKFATVGPGGIATHSDDNVAVRVMKRVDENHVKVFIDASFLIKH